MLVLTRKKQESIVIDGCITVTIIHVQGNTIRLGIEAPREVSVRRTELAPRLARTECSGTRQSAEL